MTGGLSWPPRDQTALWEWLERGRLRCAKEVRWLRELRNRALESRGAPRTPRYSHIGATRSGRPGDPTFRVVALWLDAVPRLERDILSLTAILRNTDAALSSLEGDEEKVMAILLRDRLTMEDAASIMSISRTSAYRIRAQALTDILSFLRRIEDEQMGTQEGTA